MLDLLIMQPAQRRCRCRYRNRNRLYSSLEVERRYLGLIAGDETEIEIDTDTDPDKERERLLPAALTECVYYLNDALDENTGGI